MQKELKIKNMKNLSYQHEEKSKPLSVVLMTLILLVLSAIVTSVLIEFLEWVSY